MPSSLGLAVGVGAMIQRCTGQAATAVAHAGGAVGVVGPMGGNASVEASCFPSSNLPNNFLPAGGSPLPPLQVWAEDDPECCGAQEGGGMGRRVLEGQRDKGERTTVGGPPQR